MLSLNSVMIGSDDPKSLISFYQKVFQKSPEMGGEDFAGWMVGNTFFSVGPHSEIKGKAKEPARIIFNFETTEVKEEFERITKAGATVVKEPYQMESAWIATLSDPDGNYFQLMTPWEEQKN